MRLIKNGQEDICPFCGNDDPSEISFGELEEVDDTSAFKDCECLQCSMEFRTFYSISFDSHWEFD